MFLRFFRLRLQTLIISFSLICLIAILGIRAYSVARRQFIDTRDLVQFDLRAQTLLTRMESITLAKDRAEKKFRMTRDQAYASLLQHDLKSLKSATLEFEDSVALIYPDLKSNLGALPRTPDIEVMKVTLDARREVKLRQAHDSSLGLLHLILSALILSVAITAWLLFLFYRGLLEPLGLLNEATLKIKNGNLSHRLDTGIGVSELRAVSTQFNLMAERLESLDRAKTEFLQTISHEIKNPLAALKEGLSLLSSQGEELAPHIRKRGFSACLIASKRVETMINNLLNLSRAERGLFDFDLDVKNMSSAIQTAIDEVRPLADKKGMQIRLRSNLELQAAFNWNGIVQVFENLLLNAIKYGQENSTIEIEASTTEKDVQVRVINSGKNIATDESGKIFERFYRASNSSQQQGLGIGLHVVKQIIEAHHGKIEASSESGKTKLCFWIPRAQGVLAIGMVMLGLTYMEGCASLEARSEKNRKPETVELKDTDSARVLEHQLESVKSEKVVISTSMLRSLIQSKKPQKNQCQSLNAQLRALKTIDLEEAQ